MSAFICSDSHIATIACYFHTDKVEAQKLANDLMRTNVRSVNHRYKESNPFTEVDLAQAKSGYNGSDIIRLLECLDYQSCEHPDYDQGRIIELTQRIIKRGDNLAVARANLWSI
jgi:hypothetical protein